VPRILFINGQKECWQPLLEKLAALGFTCFPISPEEIERGSPLPGPVDGIAVEFHRMSGLETGGTGPDGRSVPVLLLLPEKDFSRINGHLARVDDFITEPFSAGEVALRFNRLLARQRKGTDENCIRLADLVIDTERVEVWLGGQQIVLTFREYELLRCLAAQPGRVFTREVLLDRVWGHDYFGGDRTVDVHIRRLRAKLEDSGHTFIDTVRNIGYRFRKGV